MFLKERHKKGLGNIQGIRKKLRKKLRKGLGNIRGIRKIRKGLGSLLRRREEVRGSTKAYIRTLLPNPHTLILGFCLFVGFLHSDDLGAHQWMPTSTPMPTLNANTNTEYQH